MNNNLLQNEDQQSYFSIKNIWIVGIFLIGLAYILYAADFIKQSSFLVDDVRYYALFDDSMISMTYARNLAEGAGMVWNAGGERVEGISNPLWVVFMAFFHLFPIPEAKMSLVFQVSGIMLFLWCLLFVVKISLHLLPDNKLGVLLAVLMTAFYYPFSIWNLLGVEVSLLLLIMAAATWEALKVLKTRRFSCWLYLLLGVGTLVRFDMVVAFVVIWGWMVLFDSENRFMHLKWGFGSFLTFLGGQTILRWLYYGEWLPNTYYLKMTGYPFILRIQRGFSVLLDFIRSLKFPYYLLPLFVFLFKNKKMTGLLFTLFAAQCAYSVYVGGDAWEYRGGSNRFISIGMPFFFILYTVTAIYLFGFFMRLFDTVAEKIIKNKGIHRFILKFASVGGGVALVLFSLMSILYFNRLIDRGSLRYDLQHPSNRNNPLRYAFLEERPFFTKGSERYVKDALIIRSVTTPDATVALVAAGNLSYFLHRESIDLLGKSDVYIARQPVRISIDPENFLDFRPGHNKWDYAYSIGQLKPDVIVEIFKYSDNTTADPYLGDYEAHFINGHPTYFLTSSPNILWDLVQEYPKVDD